VVKEHGEEQEDGALKFGEGGDPGDGFGVDGMESEPEGGPEGEEGGVEGSDEQINEGNDGGVQEDINKVPANGMLAEELVFGGVGEELKGTIVVGADVGFVFGLTSEVPNFTGENLAEIFAFADDGILEDLELVVGDEVVAECGGVEGDGEEDEDGEMEEAGAARFGATAGRESGGGRSGDGSGLGRLGRVFAFSGQGFGLNLQILVTE